jgi:hypothetical protein
VVIEPYLPTAGETSTARVPCGIDVRLGSWLRKKVPERSKAVSDWLASTLKRADWLFLRSRGLETLLKLPEVILSDLETPRQPAAQARIAARSGFTPTRCSAH